MGQTVNSVFYVEALTCLKCYSAEKDGQYRNYLILHHDNVSCHTPLQCSSFWWRYKSQPSSSHHILQIPLDVTSGSFWDSRLFSKVIVSCLYKKFNRIWEQSHSYTKRGLPGVLRAMARMLEQVCLCIRAVFQWLLGKVSYTSVFTTNYVWVPETLWSSHIHVIPQLICLWSWWDYQSNGKRVVQFWKI